MTERSGDPRTARTVDALHRALRESLSTRSLDEITVSGLCRVADVRRTTFYTHYLSVSDLLTEMLTDEIDELLETPSPAGLPLGVVAANFQRTLVTAFGLVTKNRSLFRAAFESDAGAPLRRALLALFARRVEIALDIWHDLGVDTPADSTVPIAFAAGGLATAVEAWALSDETDSVAWAAAVRDQMAPWWPRVGRRGVRETP